MSFPPQTQSSCHHTLPPWWLKKYTVHPWEHFGLGEQRSLPGSPRPSYSPAPHRHRSTSSVLSLRHLHRTAGCQRTTRILWQDFLLPKSLLRSLQWRRALLWKSLKFPRFKNQTRAFPPRIYKHTQAKHRKNHHWSLHEPQTNRTISSLINAGIALWLSTSEEQSSPSTWLLAPGTRSAGKLKYRLSCKVKPWTEALHNLYSISYNLALGWSSLQLKSLYFQ